MAKDSEGWNVCLVKCDWNVKTIASFIMFLYLKFFKEILNGTGNNFDRVIIDIEVDEANKNYAI